MRWLKRAIRKGKEAKEGQEDSKKEKEQRGNRKEKRKLLTSYEERFQVYKQPKDVL